MIKQDGFGYSESEKELNWAATYAERMLKEHKNKSPIDHPDKSVTAAKLADDVYNKIDGMIKNEAGALAEADAEILEKIIAETAARKEADNALGEEIGGEANARETADTELTARIELVEYKAHMHANKSVLDGIDAERVSIWDSIKTQVTAAQLDALRAYFDELCFGFSDEIKRIYDAMGVTLYDGGMFGMMQEDTPLDGGSFADTELNLFDCGGFGKYGITAEVGAVVDGGQY